MSGKVKYNYSIGDIEIKGTNPQNISGIIGKRGTTSLEISNNYYELNKSNVTLNNQGEGLSTENMKTQSFVDSLNGEQNPLVWEIRANENDGYPVLIKETE